MKILRALPKIFELFAIFCWEVLKANLEVAKCILRPKGTLKPQFFSYPLRVQSDSSVFWLSQMITLTPGTLSLHFDREQKILDVHCLHTDNLNNTISGIAHVFEDRLIYIEGVLK